MSALPANPLLPIPINHYREGNTGIPYAFQFDSGKPGRNVGITALVHGNEVCGAHALDLLLREKFRPARGKLTLVFCNVAAYSRFDPNEPTASRFVDEDMNRVWGPAALDGERHSIELERAREIEPLIGEIDLLLDLHSMQQFSPPLMLSGPLQKGRDLAARVGVPAVVVADEGHKAGVRMRDYDGFGDPSSQKNALLVECGQHWEQSSRTVAIETMLRFLKATGAADDAFLTAQMASLGVEGAPAPQKFVTVTDAVTIETDRFVFADNFTGLECIPAAGTVIATKRLKPGQTAVRLGRYIAA
jgi:predicted deacylase